MNEGVLAESCGGGKGVSPEPPGSGGRSMVMGVVVVGGQSRGNGSRGLPLSRPECHTPGDM